MKHQSRKMDCENTWLDGQNESSNSTISRAVQQCSPYIIDPSYISANTNPGFYNVPHYGSKEFPSCNNYLAEPYQGNINSYHPYYNHGNAMAHGNFPPFLTTQPCTSAMERKNSLQINHLQHIGIHTQGRIMRSNRKSKQQNKKQLKPEKHKSTVSFGPTVPNYINTENNNQQNNFGTTANIYNAKALPTSQSLSIGNGGNRNDDTNECSFTETNSQHSTAGENLTNSSTNFNLRGGLFNEASATKEDGLDFESIANIYRQEENITNFEKEDSNASNKCNIFDDVFTKSITDANCMQPLDMAQLPDDSKEKLLLNAQNTINLVIYNGEEGEERTFTLQKISEVEVENGKTVILLSAAPEIQQQIVQGHGVVDKIAEAQSIQAEKNTSIRENAGTTESIFTSNENGLNFGQNNAPNIAEYFGHETDVKTPKRRNRTRRKNYSHRQTRCKRFMGNNSKSGTAVITGTCLPRLRRVSFGHQKRWRARLNRKNYGFSFKDLQNQYFSRFAEEYFKKNHINDEQLQNLMMIMLNEIGGRVFQSICCFFGALRRNYIARTP